MPSTTDLLNSIQASENGLALAELLSAQAAVQALIVEELRRLHEGVLARYGLRPSQYTAWKAVQGH
jgi:hypothetical protein